MEGARSCVKRIVRRVLQFRLSEAEYGEIAKAAAAADRTISQEAARRLSAYSDGPYPDALPVETRAKLLTASKVNHVSVPYEIARRLVQMFAYEDCAEALFGGHHTMKLATRVAGAILRAEQRLGRPWYTDTSSIIETKAAVMQEMTGYAQIEALGFERRPNAR
jgi:hypothetical protein